MIESYNIIFCGNVEQIEVAKNALKKCTDEISVLFCCNSTVLDSNGNLELCTSHAVNPIVCLQQRDLLQMLQWL